MFTFTKGYMRLLKLLVTVNLFVVVISMIPAGNCPVGCSCSKESESEKWMTCKGIEVFPPSTDMISLLFLNMSGNSLTVIQNDSFHNLSKVTAVDLSHNNIASIDDQALDGQRLPRLSFLNLSHNALASYPKHLPESLKQLKLDFNHIHSVNAKDLCLIQNVNLANNKLTEILLETEKVDKRCDLQKLEILNLDNNLIASIDRRLWKHYSQLRYLYLSNNQITTIKADAFKGLRFLEYLELSGNLIKSVAPKALHHLYDLKYLSLGHNVIDKFPEELPMLEWFDISDNHIQEIQEDKKTSLYPQEVFLIGQNPLRCDCAMLWVKELYDTREYQLKFINVKFERFTPVCSTPAHLKGDSWDVLANDAFGCRNQGNTDAEHTESDKDEIMVWKLKDFAVKVVTIGDTFLKLEWDSVNVGVRTTEKHVVLFHIHPFGKKNLRRTVSVHPQIGRYVLKALKPSTAYVVCISIVQGSSLSQSVASDDCLEIMTIDLIDETNSMMWYWLQNPTFYLVICTVSVFFIYICTW